MAIDTTSLRSRRSLLGAVLGGAAAAVAATLAGAQRVLAGGDDGSPILVGSDFNSVQHGTALRNNSNDNTVFVATSSHAGTGVFGGSGSDAGVYGASTSGPGVYGTSDAGDAVHGVSNRPSGYASGVLGEATNPDGVGALGNNYATKGNAQGVQGTTDSPEGWANTGWARQYGTGIIGASGPDFPSEGVPASTGVFGYAQTGNGVHGKTARTTGFASGVLGEITNPNGVGALGNNYAATGPAQGVQGTTDSPKGWGTTGWARTYGTAIVGVSGPGFPSNSVPAGTGVFGYAQKGRGGVFSGPTAQLRLVPSSAATHPGSGSAGDLFLDASKRLWFCKGGTTWKQIA